MSQQIKVLVADDHPMFLEGVSNALKKFEQIKIVAECTNAGMVEDFLLQSAVDVAVLDINMPDKDGIALARLIKQLYPATKIVFLTMYAPESPEVQQLSQLADGYVLKNSGSNILCNAIESVFAGRKYLEPGTTNILPQEIKQINAYKTKLSTREKQIVKLVLEGKGNREIARDLFLSELTIKTHRKNIYEKLQTKNVAELMQAINKLGINLHE